MSQTNQNPYHLPLLDAVCRRGVLCNVRFRYWRGFKKLRPEDLGLDPSQVSERLIRLGHKRLVPKEALQPFALIESRAHAVVETDSSAKAWPPCGMRPRGSPATCWRPSMPATTASTSAPSTA